MHKRIAYVGPFNFPTGGAPARRVHGLVKSLRMGGHEVLIGAGQRKQVSADVRDDALHGTVTYLDETPDPRSPKVLKAIRHFTWGKNTVRWLDGLDPRPDAVLSFGGFIPYALRLLPWCRRAGVPWIVDMVEWYQPSHPPLGPLGPYRINSELSVRVLYAQAGNIIAISRFFEAFYRGKGCRTVRIPPTLDVQAMPARLEDAELTRPLTLAYTGVPGKKDLLDNVVEALLRIDPSGQKMQLVIAGPQPNEILRFSSMRRRDLTTLPGCVQVLGRLPFDQAVDTVRHADFSVLLRPPLRYAQAGFPTKVPESLAVGTPVICNLTSDLGEYIRDGEEGLICPDFTVEALIPVLERAVCLNAKQKRAMRLAARKRAEESFDYREYVESLGMFIQEVCEK